MQAYLLDFTNFMLRWLHVIAAIAWIGESIYFVMLDNGLRTPKAVDDRDKGVSGEMWAVHGGGFYHNQKYATAPASLPDDLHWSFWKAYTTWLSGFALFVMLYMTSPGFYLVNSDSDWAWVANMSGWQANLLALLFLLGGWVAYNALCKRISPNMERDGLLSLVVAVLMLVVAYLSTQLFTGRAAFLLTGAVMATAMSANVFFWIIPGQRRMVAAMKAGEAPNPLDGKRGKQRSVHNTYFTLPVVLLMVSNHSSFAYSHEQAWVIMGLFILAGALIRQFFVVMHTGRIQPAYPLAGVGLIAMALWLAAPAGKPAGDDEAGFASGPSLDEVHAIVERRCTGCHASEPSMEGFGSAPAGVTYDDRDQVRDQRERIKDVVASGYMPLGNRTEMTDDEREIIADWEQ